MAGKNKKGRERKLQLLAELSQRWPRAFNLENPKPLRVGIHKTILAKTNIPEKQLSYALALYTHRVSYYKGILNSKKRVGLNGVGYEPITDDEREHAKQQIRELRKIFKARKAKVKAQAQQTKAPDEQKRSTLKLNKA